MLPFPPLPSPPLTSPHLRSPPLPSSHSSLPMVTHLARRFGEVSSHSVAEAYLRVMGACGFHMLIEAAAYTLAGLAGVFLSKGILQYALDSAPLASIAESVGSMLLAGFGLVVAGAIWEAHLTPLLVQLLG